MMHRLVCHSNKMTTHRTQNERCVLLHTAVAHSELGTHLLHKQQEESKILHRDRSPTQVSMVVNVSHHL